MQNPVKYRLRRANGASPSRNLGTGRIGTQDANLAIELENGRGVEKLQSRFFNPTYSRGNSCENPIIYMQLSLFTHNTGDFRLTTLD